MGLQETGGVGSAGPQACRKVKREGACKPAVNLREPDKSELMRALCWLRAGRCGKPSGRLAQTP